jgi:hypothetical protein
MKKNVQKYYVTSQSNGLEFLGQDTFTRSNSNTHQVVKMKCEALSHIFF